MRGNLFYLTSCFGQEYDVFQSSVTDPLDIRVITSSSSFFRSTQRGFDRSGVKLENTQVKREKPRRPFRISQLL